MKKIILDHDLGTNPDDFFSLLMLLNSESIDLPLVISGNNHPLERARLAKKIVYQHGRKDVKIASGEAAGTIDFNAFNLIEDFQEDVSSDYKTEIKKILDENEEVIYVCIQGTTNLASFLSEYPEYVDTLKVIHMGMSLSGTTKYIGGGTNMEADSMSAKYLYELELKQFKVVGSHTTINDAIRAHPDTVLYKKISSSESPNHKMLTRHLHDYYERRGIWPALHDPLTTSVALGFDFVDFEDVYVDFNDKGKYKMGSKTKVKISKPEIKDPKSFMRLCTELV